MITLSNANIMLTIVLITALTLLLEYVGRGRVLQTTVLSLFVTAVIAMLLSLVEGGNVLGLQLLVLLPICINTTLATLGSNAVNEQDRFKCYNTAINVTVISTFALVVFVGGLYLEGYTPITLTVFAVLACVGVYNNTKDKMSAINAIADLEKYKPLDRLFY